MQRFIILFVFVFSFQILSAQKVVTIPAFTAYAIPAENDEEDLFDAKEKFLHWNLKEQSIQFNFNIKNAGTLDIAIIAKTNDAKHFISASVNKQSFKISITKTAGFKEIKIGSSNILTPGFYSVIFSGLKETGEIFIQSLQLKGTAVEGIHFNAKPRRNAASVHLMYPLSDTMKAVQFYNELKVPKGADIIHSYYMACGFTRGYFGMQVNSAKERRVIFSIWDAGNEALDRNKVADSNRVQLVAKGEDVIAEGFGNEGTGGHSHWVYDWKADTTYKFLVTIIPDSATKTTIYTGYFYMPEKKQWKLIAGFKAPHDGKYLSHLYSFNENFVGVNGQLQRKAYFGNQWIQRETGQWVELNDSKFSMDATGKSGDRIDFGAGVENNLFYLWNGGFTTANAKYGDAFTRIANKQRPLIELNKNSDSLVQSQKEKAEIEMAVASKKIDTTASVNGVYYQILKEGTGRLVKVSDTVSVFYKGSLLSDGSVFDQTKDKPASFPLNRLIKGWQIGLPLCKEGGKIRLIIPSGLAYNIRSRSKAIPPNSILIFDIEVLATK